MKAIVIGGAGHIGTYLVPMLVKAGYETISVTRGNSKPYVDDPAWGMATKVRLDRQDAGFEQKIADMNADVVIDLINFDVNRTRAIVEALRNTRCTHYLYCSSCWSHGRAEVLPFDPNDLQKEPLDRYGEDKFASEQYLKDEYRRNGFPATIIHPCQISGPGWTIMNPWANKCLKPFEIIARGEKIFLPNFGMETLHHVHGYDVAQVFFLAIIHRNQALGESFFAASGQSITLYGYAKLMYSFFGKEPDIGFMPWEKWCEYVGDEAECSDTWHHIARSGYYSIEKERRLLDYHPRYTNLETIKLAVQSYVDRGLIKG